MTDLLNQLPHPNSKRIAVYVTPAAESALRGGHPWLFERAIRQQSHDGQAGDLAVIFDRKKRFLAVGLYDPASPMRVKVLQHNQPASINGEWFAARVTAAAQMRQALVERGITGYRLLHGENDGLPGLICDRYAGTLVVKLYTAAWLPHLRDVLAALKTVQPAERIVLRLSRALGDPYGLRDGGVIDGAPLTGPVEFVENGLHFAADVQNGHKTGFFFDHRDNRARVGDLAAGRRVLDVFAYVGAFSLYAARGGAESVLSVDVSAPALQAARQNFALNVDNPRVRLAQHDTLAGDAFEALEQFAADGRRFDLIVADPPSFAKSRAEAKRALAAYTRLTRSAVKLLDRDGWLVMASCSSRVSADDFATRVLTAAADAGHPLHEVERTAHALDHPVGFPEGAYLKCLYATRRA